MKTNKIKLRNDEVGSNDIYYQIKGKEIKYSKNLHDFKGEIDWVAIVEFLIFEFPLNDRTFIKDVKILEYGTEIVFNKGKVRKNKLYSYDFIPTCTPRLKLFKKFDELLKNQIIDIKKKYPNEKFLIGISGGLDSRLILKYALQENLEVIPFSFGERDSDNLFIAEKICKLFNKKLIKINIEKDSYFKYKDLVLERDPHSSLSSTYYLFPRNILKGNYILTGYMADNIFGSHIKKSDFSEKNIIKKIYDRYAEKEVLNFLPKEITKEIEKDLERYSNQKSEHWKICEKFNYENRQQRFIKNSPAFTFYKFKDIAIFNNKEIIDFATSLPLRELNNSKFYHDFIKLYHPELAKIRCEREPFSLLDSSFSKRIKKLVLRIKKLILYKTKINLPIYKRINTWGQFNWNKLIEYTEKIDFNNAREQFNWNKLIEYIEKIDFNKHPLIKFRILTIINFINKQKNENQHIYQTHG